jgi:nitroreductase
MSATPSQATVEAIEQRALDAREQSTDRVDDQFVARSSPRAFADEPVDEADLEAIFEAARWAPSSYNEQPWRFAYAVDEADRERFLEAILDANETWAKDAPVLALVLADTTFDHDGSENRHAWFDSGAAWMSLALQAHELGLATHAMGGIDPERAAEILDAPEDYEVVCAIAIGVPGDPERLPDELAEQERSPSDRKPLDEIVAEGGF